MNSMKTITGKSNIKATIIKDSIGPDGIRLITYELEYPRFVHSEVMTHCMLEKNAASSRAVPVESALSMIETTPAMPVEWGANNAGMVSKSLLDDTRREAAEGLWLSAMKTVVSYARVMADKTGINAHKQIVNRMCEPWVMMKTVMTGTEWSNFFWLRHHLDADPTFRELARVMLEAKHASIPTLLQPGQWHLPYVEFDGTNYKTGDQIVDLETAKKISASCCAQVSYRKLDDSVEKALKIYDMLNIGSTDKPAHASPLTHQGTPMQAMTKDINTGNVGTWESGVTHMRRNGSLWSGKFQSWIQHRQLVPNEAKWDE
jgi:hypothetical protein